MKKMRAIVLCLVLVTGKAFPQAATADASQTGANPPPPPPYQIISQGADFNIWQWQTFEPAPGGGTVSKTHSYN